MLIKGATRLKFKQPEHSTSAISKTFFLCWSCRNLRVVKTQRQSKGHRELHVILKTQNHIGSRHFQHQQYCFLEKGRFLINWINICHSNCGLPALWAPWNGTWHSPASPMLASRLHNDYTTWHGNSRRPQHSKMTREHSVVACIHLVATW